MMRHVDERWTWVRRGGVVSLAVIAIAAAGLSVRGGSQPAEPAPDVFDSIDWQVDGLLDESLLDLADLAEVHATSRLQYDDCQQDYAAISSEMSSSRNPQYFC